MARVTGGFREDPAFGTPTATTPIPVGGLGIGEALRPGELTALPEGGEAVAGGGMLRQIWQVFAENKLAVASLAYIVFMILFCFLGPHLYHTEQVNQQVVLATPSNAPPGSGHPLGTDQTGFDILGRLMYGGKASLIVGLASAFVATVVGVLYGAASGFFGGWFDSLLMRIVDVFLSIPILFLLIALATIFQPISETFLIGIIAFVSWFIPARLIRGETLGIRVREYVQAVRVMGGRGGRVVGRHIIPNAVGTIVVFATFQVADSILLLAALGFLGFGIPAPGTDWGSMLAVGTDAAGNGWWWQIFPVGFCIVSIVVAFNFIGDALRDSLEVRLQRR
jgi:peptide/nickel transport system permease protein